MPAAPFDAGQPILALAANPAADFLYTVAMSGGLEVYSIDASTGVISGTLAAGAVGAHNVDVSVTDGSASDHDTFTWTVNASNTAPVVDSVTVTPERSR